MIVKSYLTWYAIFDNIPLWQPLLTEVPFVWLIFCFIERFSHKRKIGYYMIANLTITIVFFAAIMYYKYYGVIVTYHALAQVNQVTSVNSSVFSLLAPYYLLIFVDIIVLCVYFIRRRIQRSKLVFQTTRSLPRIGKKTAVAIFAFSALLTIFNVWPNRASMNELTQAESMGILNYEAYMIAADKPGKPVPKEQITQHKINTMKGFTPDQPAISTYWDAAKGRNVIIVQMESFQNFLIGLHIDGKEITPNLNKLAKESLYFPHFYQQVGQGNTSDAEFVVNSSYYIPARGAASQEYAGFQVPSLAKLLDKYGYNTTTFHTNKVEFWNRKEMYAALGFGKYYDMDFFGNEDAVAFAASDEVLYKKTSKELKALQDTGKPFYSQVISMSAHHPYHLPESKYKMELPARYENTLVGDYIRSQNYADYELGTFIQQLKDNGVWDNSLIVLYGDHLGLPLYSLEEKDRTLMKEIFGRDYTRADMMNIPLIISAPGAVDPARIDQLGGQSDIVPTVASLLGVSMDGYIHFGQDLLNGHSNLLPERYYLPSGSLITEEGMFVPGSGYEDGTQYPLPSIEETADPSFISSLDPPPDSLKETGKNLNKGKVSKEQYERALNLLHYSDSYVSQLPMR
ncbi:LTA synthase family protein [Paenibacillus sp. Marseille-Q4541]|uniref:LTA synthase family protein n=1 Tax=Paenibacillus sp. Marseille-Q4541 TaxID=2831522 RepID=UPI001BA5975B|nr:LTA synthase family protein [Paenibacillus sp. Marseille-Q4541]